MVDFTCGGEVRDLRIRDDLFDVLGADYHTLARIEAPGRDEPVRVLHRVARDPRSSSTSGGRGAASFVLLGIEHILTGWDHLLFLLGLLLRGGGWLSLVKIVTAFTLAHSVTLALAVLDVVTLPDRLVEAVIALSIALRRGREPLRAAGGVRGAGSSASCFGLVHGFGFSSALREVGLPTQGLAARRSSGSTSGSRSGRPSWWRWRCPLLALLRRTRWEPRVIRSSSLAILLVGVVLFVRARAVLSAAVVNSGAPVPR